MVCSHWTKPLFISAFLALAGCGKVKPQVIEVPKDGAVIDAARPDAARVCDDGLGQCVGQEFQRCVNGQWESVKVCEEECDAETGCSEDHNPPVDLSFIWISNTGEDTLSKVDTRTAVEVARYRTCPNPPCDPSRTSVNLYGDAVVTNRQAAPSSVTKFAANEIDCVDRDNSGTIETSTGPADVKPWGQDECMLWNTQLPDGQQFDMGSHGARATAWNGEEDPETGVGGHIWVGTCTWGGIGTNRIYKLNGDTGVIEETVMTPQITCHYGGAMDPNGDFWVIDMMPAILGKLDTVTLEVTTVQVTCGYGITVDAQGRIWVGGMSWTRLSYNCVSRYDPATLLEDFIQVPSAQFLRGIAVGVEKSAGYVWAADTMGTLYKVDENTLTVTDSYVLGSQNEMIGVAVDYEGYVWTVSMMNNTTYKFDPDTTDATPVMIGNSPYTYSDMTGVQLRNVVVVE